jgi:hypothetical protein
MIEVQIKERWQERLMEVYIYELLPNGYVRLYLPYSESSPGFIDNPPAMILDTPSLLLSPDMLKALVEAGLKITPPNTSMQNHLEDAIKVRDRLLTLVEDMIPAPPVREYIAEAKK